jgi:phosphoribosylformimino-5-aminoimidazole carboxamide ribotide isomerase
VRIIPVIDLLGGVVVRGVAGRRSEYQPIRSRLCPSSEPAAVARALVEHFGLPELYVADLDAIAGREPAWQAYEQIAAAGARLLVDAGAADVGRATALAQFRACREQLAGVIAGLESVASPALLKEMLAAVGPDRLIFSLDLKHGQPITDGPAWRDMTPAAIAASAISAGIKRLIVLDLADVGTGGGVGTLVLCRDLRAAHPSCELIAGGGVRGPDDLRQLAASGCSAALVASALHDGRVGNDECRMMNAE